MWAVPQGYRAIPRVFNLATEVLDDAIAHFGLTRQPAIWTEQRTLCYEDLRRQVDGAARGLMREGLARGERVLVRGGNSPELAIAFLGVVKAGGIPVMAHSLLAAGEIEYILENSGAQWAIVDAEGADAVRAAWVARSVGRPICCFGGGHPGDLLMEDWIEASGPPVIAAETSKDDPAFMVYTSGTTGRPKAILHAHRWVAAVGDLARLRANELRPGEVSYAVGEITSISALGHTLLYPLRTGGVSALVKGRAKPERVASIIERARVNLLFGTPTLYRMLLARPSEPAPDFSSVRMANSGGESAGAAMKSEWESRYGGAFYEYFGISEFQMLLANGDGIPVKTGSVGVSFPDTHVTVLDSALRPAKAGEPGLLAIPADDPGLFLTYYGRPELWRKAFRGRYYISGDEFTRDEDGYFWFAGRKDDVFKSRGYTISPLEIEDALMSHSEVLEAVVIPVPDERIGYAIRAVVVPKSTSSNEIQLAQDLIAHVKSRLAPYKAPWDIKFVSEMPRHGPLSKVSRKAVARALEHSQ